MKENGKPPPYKEYYSTLLEKFWRISLYVTDDAFSKLYVTQNLVKLREMVESFVTYCT